MIKWLSIKWLELLMWCRQRFHSKKYRIQKMWFNIGQDMTNQETYAQVCRFVKDKVNLAPRPYGQGFYTLVLATVWDENTQDRWEIHFSWLERAKVYDELASRLNSCSPPPLCLAVWIIPYGSLALGKPIGETHA